MSDDSYDGPSNDLEGVLLIRHVEGYLAMPSYTQHLVDGMPADPGTIELVPPGGSGGGEAR